MRSTLAIALTLVAMLSPALAGVADVSPALRQRAEVVCRSDALRLCAEAIPDDDAIVTCMRPKRALLTAPCRRIFDDVMRAVNR